TQTTGRQVYEMTRDKLTERVGFEPRNDRNGQNARLRYTIGEGEALAAAEPLGEPQHREETAAESTFPVESPSDESLLAQRELEPAVGIPLRGRDAALPAELDRSTSLAASEAFREAGRNAAGSPGRHSELLPNANRDGHGGSDQRQYQDLAAARPPAIRTCAICCSRPSAWQSPGR